MSEVSKRIKVTGRCTTCRKNAVGWVIAKGPKGQTGDWRGSGTCEKCGSKVYLEKRDIKF